MNNKRKYSLSLPKAPQGSCNKPPAVEEDSIKCHNCGSKYHYSPSTLPTESSDSKIALEQGRLWECHKCRESKNGSKLSQQKLYNEHKTEQKDAETENINLKPDFKLFKASVSKDLIDIKEVGTGQSLVIPNNALREEMANIFVKLSETVANLALQITGLKKENEVAVMRMEQMEFKVNSLEQEILNKNKELRNLQSNSSLSAVDLFKRVVNSLISFKDGKVGVNFLGYHAEAGLGGALNDPNGGLLGGLHASAGTPWGQNAAAGLGGNVNGRAAGVLYAGAQATPNVGAGSILGGDTSRGGFSGADAYAGGKVSSSTGTITAGNTKAIYENANIPAQPAVENVNVIQKIRPPKKYYGSQAQQPVRRQLIASAAVPAALPCDAADAECKSHHTREVRSDAVHNALQIPVGILQSLQQTLGNLHH